jgi:hypothetical protein
MAYISDVAFLNLPAEIRNKIYRLVLMTEQKVGVKYTEIGPKIDSDDIKYGNSVPDLITQWHAINTAILETSRQIYHEASTILYEENDFYFAFEESRVSTVGVSFGVGMNNFKLMQKLTITFHVCTRCPSSDHACRLMETLNTLDCSFKTLILDYYFNNERDPRLLQTYFDSIQLTTSISAVNVQQEIEFNFIEKLELNATLSACLRDFVLRTAASKSWVVKAYDDLSSLNGGQDARLRYYILPKSAQVGEIGGHLYLESFPAAGPTSR